MNCWCLNTPAGEAARRPCNCGALLQEIDPRNRPAKFVGEYPFGVINPAYVEHLEAEIERLRAALTMMYDKWEYGDPCTTEDGLFLGNAFRLTQAEEDSVLALIPSEREAAPPAEAYGELLRMDREIEHLLERIEVQRGVILNHVEESRELRAEIERLRADAERYRWLRRNEVAMKQIAETAIAFLLINEDDDRDAVVGSVIDHAVDAKLAPPAEVFLEERPAVEIPRIDPEADLYSDAMDAAVGAYHSVRHGAMRNAERVGEAADGEKTVRRALALGISEYLRVLREAAPPAETSAVSRSSQTVWRKSITRYMHLPPRLRRQRARVPSTWSGDSND